MRLLNLCGLFGHMAISEEQEKDGAIHVDTSDRGVTFSPGPTIHHNVTNISRSRNSLDLFCDAGKKVWGKMKAELGQNKEVPVLVGKGQGKRQGKEKGREGSGQEETGKIRMEERQRKQG